jgi:hypothetical protein
MQMVFTVQIVCIDASSHTHFNRGTLRNKAMTTCLLSSPTPYSKVTSLAQPHAALVSWTSIYRSNVGERMENFKPLWCLFGGEMKKIDGLDAKRCGSLTWLVKSKPSGNKA